MAGIYPGWTIVVGSTEYIPKSISFTKQVNLLDSAIVELGAKVSINAIATIYYNNTRIGYGTIKSNNQVSQRTYSSIIAEMPLELKTQLARDTSGVADVVVSNPGGTLTITDYVKAILGASNYGGPVIPYGSGYKDATMSTLTVIPNTTTPLPSMRFKGMYRLAALDKFLKNTCGYLYWFSVFASPISVQYGETRSDKTAVDLQPTDVREKNNGIVAGYTEVIIYGQTMSIKGSAIASGAVSPYKTIQYQYTDSNDSVELTRIAEQILRDKSPQGLRYEVDMPITRSVTLNLNPGDLVTINWPIEGISGVTGIIRDMNYGDDIVTLGIGDKEVTQFDLLGEKLVLIDGASSFGSTYAWDGGWQNVGSLATATWKFIINDVSNIGSFNLQVYIDKFKKFMTTDPQLTGLSDTNSHMTGLTADQLKAIGINATNSKLLGLSSSNSAYTNLTGTDYLNAVGSFWSDYDTGSGGGLSYGGWTDVGDDLHAPSCSNGIWLGFAGLSVVITDSNGGSSSSGFTARLMQYKSGSWQQVGHYVYGYGPRDNAPYTITFGALILGDTYTAGTDYKWQIYSAQSNCNVRSFGSYISVIPRHEHGITDDTHANSITDVYQTHNLTDPMHYHSITDITHPHNITDENHDHNENDALTDVNSFPTSMVVKVNGTTVGTYAGGSAQTINVGEILSLLTNGVNTITITSTTAGSAFVMGEVETYGDV